MSGWKEVTLAAEARGPAGAASISALKALAPGYQQGEVFVQGYYAANDGGGGMFRWNASSSVADNGGTVIKPTSNPTTGRWERIIGEPGSTRPEWWGAKGDDTNDDTSAIQSAVNFCVTNGGLVKFANRTYKITAAITFAPVGVFNTIQFGCVGFHSWIKQYTTNTPIFIVDDSFPNGFLFEGINFSYSANQPATNTSAVAILCDAIQQSGPDLGRGVYNFTINRCRFMNCFRGIAQTQSGNRPVWGMWMRGCEGGFNMSGALAYLASASGDGQPNIHIQDCYIRRNDGLSTQEHSVYIKVGSNVHLENVEVNGGQGPVFYLNSCLDVRITSCRIESSVFPTSFTSVCDFAASKVVVDNFHLQSANFSPTSGSQSIFYCGFGGIVELRSVKVQSPTIGAGNTVYVVDGGTTPNNVTSLILSSLDIPSTVAKYSSSADWLPYALKFDSLESRRPAISANRGDANVTLNMNDAPIQRFTTTLTANRTATLPTTGQFAGATFRIVRGAGGAFTLTVSTLTPANKVFASATQGWVDVMWDGSAWIETAQGTYP